MKLGLLPLLILFNINLFGQSSMPEELKRPNIIIYVADDLGTGDAGCYGNSVIKTPSIDYLSDYGTRFNNAYCTSPSCSASRSVILSGLYNHANGQYGHSHFEFHFSAFDYIKTLPVVLDSAGYRTMRTGKIHVAPAEVFKFGDYLPKKEEDPDRVWKSFSEAPRYPHASDFSPEELAEKCRSFISSTDESPFFLYFCTFEPHDPFKRSGSDTISPKDVIVPEHLTDNDYYREELSKYYMSAQRMDKGLGRLIEILKETGKWENTIILFTSDNGRPFPAAKANLYEPGINMPFIFRNPYEKEMGHTSDALINFTDIMPTILDFVGIDSENYNLHGKSFREELAGKETGRFNETYASHTFHEIQMYYPMRMIRDKRYKLIWNLAYGQTFPMGVDGDKFLKVVKEYNMKKIGQRTLKQYLIRPKYELYDLVNDPHELDNLAYKKKYQDILKKYVAKLYQFQENTNDPWVIYQKYEEVESLVK